MDLYMYSNENQKCFIHHKLIIKVLGFFSPAQFLPDQGKCPL
jgi:hypothetical protein